MAGAETELMLTSILKLKKAKKNLLKDLIGNLMKLFILAEAINISSTVHILAFHHWG